MGKRKSSKKPQTRVKQVLDKSFRCVFCAHQGSVTCKMDTKNRLGRLDCKDCGQTFTMDINHLSEPVDVYSAWIDACEDANPAEAAAQPRPSKSAATSSSKKRRADDDDDDEEEEEEEAVDRDAPASDDEDDLPDVRPRKLRKGASRDVEEEEDDDDE
ncbi:hypothetical protein JCM11251_005826 [Rhodosporidiobolus azoricus]